MLKQVRSAILGHKQVISKVVQFTNDHVTDKVNCLPTMPGEPSEYFLTFEACCEPVFEFSKHVNEFTNERRPDGPSAIPLIDIIETARDSSKYDEFALSSPTSKPSQVARVPRPARRPVTLLKPTGLSEAQTADDYPLKLPSLLTGASETSAASESAPAAAKPPTSSVERRKFAIPAKATGHSPGPTAPADA
jgi:hypothetical protein